MSDLSPVQTSFKENRFLQVVAAVYGLIWIITAIQPSHRQDWLLENLPVFLVVPVLVATHRRFQFSNLSYSLMALFLILHAVGAHYTYTEMPLGNWVRDGLNLQRNHYDRVVHFLFGLFIAYPIRELLVRAGGLRGAWTYILPAHVVMAWSGCYEILEGIVAQMVSPELGAAYNGIQGDIWDAQKDMSLALLGAAIAMALTAASPLLATTTTTRRGIRA